MKKQKGINTRYNPFVRYLHATTGITLIALVITIIVMLILAGVSLNVLVGDNGVLTQAQEAKTTHEAAEEKELIDMAIAGAQMNTYPDIDYSTLVNNIKSSFGEEASVSKMENEETGLIDYLITLPSGKTYSTSSNLKILDIFIEEKNPLNADGIGVEGYMIEILDQTIGLRFYFTMPDEILNTGAKIKFSQVDGRIQEIEVDKANKFSIGENEYYYVTAECYSQMMANDITFCMYDESGEAISDEYTYSIKSYGNAVIANEENYVTELKQNQVEYIKALLYFGGMMQKYNTVNTSNLASEKIEINTSWITKEFLKPYEGWVSDNPDKELIYASSLMIGSTISLGITMTESINASNKDEYRLKVDEELYVLEKTNSKGQYICYIPVKMTDFDKMFNIQVIDAADQTKIYDEMKYGIYSYVKVMLYENSNATQELKDALEAIVNLSECSKKVF